jgi:phosphoglycolate phosphatase
MSSGGRLSKPDAVIFDWDGTLADGWGAIGRSLNATFEHYGQPTWSMEEVRARTKASARDAFPKLFGDPWEEALAFFYARFEDYHAGEVKPLPGAENLLAALKDHGVPIALVSNKTGRYLRAEAEILGWSSLFVNMIGATDAARDKPAPDPVHMALAGTNLSAGPGIWFVGDAVPDMECAHATGCVPILLQGGTFSDEEFEKWPPRAEFATCVGLLESFLNCARA